MRDVAQNVAGAISPKSEAVWLELVWAHVVLRRKGMDMQKPSAATKAREKFDQEFLDETKEGST